MGKNQFKSKKITYENRGDKIEVKLMNETYQTFYKKVVSVHDKKGIQELYNDLVSYGIKIIPVPKDSEWFT